MTGNVWRVRRIGCPTCRSPAVARHITPSAPNEDPKFPKLQWPTRDLCPLCWGKESDHLNEEEVLNFLKNFYSTDNMSGQYTVEETNESEAEPAIEAEKKEDSMPKKLSRLDEKAIQDLNMKPELTDKLIQNNRPVLKDLVKSGKELVATKEDKQSIFFLGIGFSSIDLSLCVVLYIASSLFLMIMYFFFRMRSRRWKVRYNRPYV